MNVLQSASLPTNPPAADKKPGSPNGQAAAPGAEPPAWHNDLLCGLTTGVLAVPQGIAFALIAHVPPEYGLYAMIVPTIVAALIRNSPFLITGSTNTSALVIGALVASLALTPERIVPTMLLITLLMGLIQVLIGVLRLGTFGRYVSHAVLMGFTLGAATLIFTDQIRNVLGLHVSSSPRLLDELAALAPHLGGTDWRTALLAALTMGIVAGCARISRLVPGAMVAVAATAALTWALGWHAGPDGIQVVGAVPRSLPGLTTPAFSWPLLQDVAAPSLAIAILGMVEAISIGKALSSKARMKFHANQELSAQGLGNVVGAFTGCMPTSASWTRSAINLQMGAKTRWVGVYAGLTVLAIMLALAPWAQYVPKACLGALIMWIAWSMIDLHAARYVWRWSRTDAAVLVITYLSMLVIEIQYAIYLGVLISILMLLRRAGQLHMVEMARASADHFREIEIDEQTGKHPIVLLQLEGDLFFGIVEELEDKLERIAANGARVIVLRLKRAHAIDATAAEALAAFAAHFKTGGGRMILCGLKPELLEQIKKAHFGEILGAENLLPTEAQAFASVRHAIDEARRLVRTEADWPADKPMIRPAPAEMRDAWSYSI
ncbi:MAG: SulP family inorganic anion transporter [Planctomycetota bacterium]|nr:SulP family inorganic anion transporter [Planctomycetota bacterium]